MLGKSIACLMVVSACVAGQKVTTKATQSFTLRSMSPESMKTAYVYLKWYVENLHENNLTDAQKKQLDELKTQVDASFAENSESKAVDTQQLWQQLGELERVLAVIADAMNITPPPAVFSVVEPMSTTQISVNPARKLPREKVEDKNPSELKEGMQIMLVPPGANNAGTAPEFDPDED